MPWPTCAAKPTTSAWPGATSSGLTCPRRQALGPSRLLATLALARPTPPDSLPPPGPTHRLAYAYANDLFFGTDYYFTQGMTLDVVSPALARWPSRHLLGPTRRAGYYGLALRSDGFTPTRIGDAFIRVGDRPYAAYFFATLYRVRALAGPRQCLTTALELGYIGPAAGGKLIQTKLHELTNGTPPRGWDYQIRSDAVLGFRLTYERQLLATGRWAEVLGSAEASLGTLYTYASAGGRLRLGRFSPCLAGLGESRANSWQLYTEATGAAHLVGYDATLQGGFFNRSSPYTLACGEVRHLVPHATAALVVARGGLSFAATAVYVGPEFGGGRPHRWGVLALASAF